MAKTEPTEILPACMGWGPSYYHSTHPEAKPTNTKPAPDAVRAALDLAEMYARGGSKIQRRYNEQIVTAARAELAEVEVYRKREASNAWKLAKAERRIEELEAINVELRADLAGIVASQKAMADRINGELLPALKIAKARLIFLGDTEAGCNDMFRAARVQASLPEMRETVRQMMDDFDRAKAGA